MRVFLLLFIFLSLYLVGLSSFDVVDYDEACYAEVSRSMMLSGDYLSPELNGEPFFEKPPLLYWVQALSYKLFGISVVSARLANALAALATVMALYIFASRAIGGWRAWTCAIVLGTSLLFTFLARIALTDMLLTLFFVLCMGFAHRAVENTTPDNRGGTLYFVAACLSAALAMLTKGAVGVVLPALSILIYLAFMKKLKILLRPLWIILGLLIVCLCGFSWYLLLGFTRPEGFTFMRDLFLEHHLGRFTSPMEGHDGGLLFYIPVLLLGTLPWGGFIPLASARLRRLTDTEEGTSFLYIFAIFSAVTFLFFSIAATKLPNYILPVVPGLALMVGALLSSGSTRGLAGKGWNASFLFSICLLLLAAAAFAILPRLPQLLLDHGGNKVLRDAPGLAHPVTLGYAPYIASGTLVAGAAVAAMTFLFRLYRVSIAALALSSVILLLVIFHLLMPRLDSHFLRPLRELTLEAASLVPPGEEILLVNIRLKPSINFHARRQTQKCKVRYPDAMKSAALAGGTRYGLTSENTFPLVKQHLPTADIIGKDTGYVLFSVHSPLH